MKKQGFSLIEFLIYLTISTIISLAVCSWVTRVLYSRVLIGEKNNASLTLLMAVDCYRKDLMCAPSHNKKWLKRESKYVMWRQKSDMVVGYRLHKNRLIRIAGRYDPIKHSVDKKTSSRVATSVSGTFTIMQEGGLIKGVELYLTMQKEGILHECTQYIKIRNE